MFYRGISMCFLKVLRMAIYIVKMGVWKGSQAHACVLFMGLIVLFDLFFNIFFLHSQQKSF